jgi:nucleotidyltransferase/DNA polymerase involved in DNA repair
MHIDLDAFFVSVEQANKPELKGKPVVVGGKPGGRGVVATASYEARAFGLHSAMPIATAVRLCPQAIFIEGNYSRYAEVSKKFMAILANFSPFLEPMGLDEAYLDVTGFESLHGTIHQMAIKIKDQVKEELGIVASIGIASCKVVAKVASDESKPDGLIEVPFLLQKAIVTNRQTIRLVGICVSGLSQPGNQLSLMDNAEQRLGKLNKAVYRIRDKYGFSAFQTGRTIQLKHFN